MTSHLKMIVAAVVLFAFVSMAVLCCCVIKASVMHVKKSCAHCPVKEKTDAPAHECCFSKLIPMELAKFVSFLQIIPLAIFAFIVFILLRPPFWLARLSHYQNGPPGPFSRVPIYFRFRSIRI